MVVLTTMSTLVIQYSSGGHPDIANFIEIPLDKWICKFQLEVGQGRFLFRIKRQNK